MSKRGALWTLIFFSLALLSACGATGTTNTNNTPVPTGATSSKLPVVATYSILGNLVQLVGGEQIELTTLVGPGGDAHTFEPTPADSTALIKSRLLFENGLEFEPWLDDMFTASGSQATRIVVTEGIQAHAGEEEHEGEEHADEEQHEGEEEHEHGEYDPHVWHDVNNAIVMVGHIRDALVAADPANATVYQENAESYLAELKQLDAFVVEQANQLPAERRKLVTSHDTFGYFAERYGFTVVGTALGSASTEVADPSPAQLAGLINEIKAAGVPAIFAENVANPALMETIAREAGVQLAPTLYTDALGEAGTPGASYIEMIRYNITTIVTALK